MQDSLEVYFTLKEDNEEGMSKLKSEEQKQRVLYHMINDLNNHVEEFKYAVDCGQSTTEPWKNIERLTRLLHHVNNTSLNDENCA